MKLLPSFLPSQHSQDHLVSCSHSLCPSRGITDTIVLTPSAGSLLVPHTGMATPAVPLPLAQLAGGMIPWRTVFTHDADPTLSPVLNGCSSSTSLTVFPGATHTAFPASSHSASTEKKFCPFQHQADLSEHPPSALWSQGKLQPLCQG